MLVQKLDSPLAYIAVDMESGTILQLSPLDTDIDLCHPGSPYAAVSGPYHRDENPTLYIPTYLIVGFPSVGDKASVQALQRGPHLSDQKAVD